MADIITNTNIHIILQYISTCQQVTNLYKRHLQQSRFLSADIFTVSATPV